MFLYCKMYNYNITKYIIFMKQYYENFPRKLSTTKHVKKMKDIWIT